MRELHLEGIEERHRPDRRRDLIFIAVAALLTVLAVGAVTRQAAGNVTERLWTVTVVEGNLEVGR
jgi:hypothetical protein